MAKLVRSGAADGELWHPCNLFGSSSRALEHAQIRISALVFVTGDRVQVGRSVRPFILPIMLQSRALTAPLPGTPSAAL